MNQIHSENELLKHNAIIQSDNRSISFLDKKVMNALLINAFKDLITDEIHQITFSKLSDDVGWGHDYKRNALIESLKTLSNTEIKWNILGEDIKNDWTQSKLIASFRVISKEGILEYSYSPHLRNVLKHPNIYSKIDLLIQNNFSSKYSLNLWEFLKSQIGDKSRFNKINETEYFAIPLLKEILGVTGIVYEEFKFFKQRVINLSVDEINKKSDIYINAVNYKKEGRSYTAISFSVVYKESIQQQLPLSDEDRLKTYTKDEKYLLLKNELEQWGQSSSMILKKFESTDFQKLKGIIDAANYWCSKNSKSKEPQILTAAFRDEWAPPVSITEPSAKKRRVSKKKNVDSEIKNENSSDDEYEVAFQKFSQLDDSEKKIIEDECKEITPSWSIIGENARQAQVIFYYIKKLKMEKK